MNDLSPNNGMAVAPGIVGSAYRTAQSSADAICHELTCAAGPVADRLAVCDRAAHDIDDRAAKRALNAEAQAVLKPVV